MGGEVPARGHIGGEGRTCARSGKLTAIREVEAHAATDHQALPVVGPEVVLRVDGRKALTVIAVASGGAEANVQNLGLFLGFRQQDARGDGEVRKVGLGVARPRRPAR